MHQRVTRRANSNGDFVIDVSDVGNLYYYDSSWRLCVERIDDFWDGATTLGTRYYISNPASGSFPLSDPVQALWRLALYPSSS